MFRLTGGILGGVIASSDGDVQHDTYWLNRRINYNLLPGDLRGAAQRYIEYGISPGGFMSAAFSNNFIEAACRADIHNQHQSMMKSIAHFIVNEMPPSSYGSKEIVRAWIERGGLRGVKAKRIEEVTHTITKEEGEQ